MKKLLFFIGAFSVLLAGNASAADVLKFSMLPRYFPEVITRMITPLAEHLASKTGLNIKATLTKDFAEYENELKAGRIALGYSNPLVYIKVSETHEAIAMAVKGEGGARFRGVVITRPDSTIESLKDLKHKRIMIVGKTSAGGFLSQKLSMMEAGIDVEKDCQVMVSTDNKQENVIIAVSIGDADAGFIRESALHVADKYILPNSIHVIAQTAWLPNWAFSVNRSLPPEQKKAIQNALIELKSDSPVMKAIELEGFNVADDSQYDVMRKLGSGS